MLVGVDTLVWYLSRWFSFKLFKSLLNSWWPDFFKKNFSDVRSEIQLIRIDMVSTGQSVRLIQDCIENTPWQVKLVNDFKNLITWIFLKTTQVWNFQT